MAKKKRAAPEKTCPKCGKSCHARKNACPNPSCSHVFVKTKTAKKAVVRRKIFAVASAVKKVVKRRKKRRGRPPGRPAAASSGGGFSLVNIQAAKALIKQVGGTSKTKKLLDVLG